MEKSFSYKRPHAPINTKRKSRYTSQKKMHQNISLVNDVITQVNKNLKETQSDRVQQSGNGDNRLSRSFAPKKSGFTIPPKYNGQIEPYNSTLSLKKPDSLNNQIFLKSNFNSFKGTQLVSKSTSSSFSNEPISVQDYDILNIDNQIRIKITSDMDDIHLLKQDMTRLVWILENCNSLCEQNIATNHIVILKKQIIDIERGSPLLLYLSRTSNIVERYKQIDSVLRPRSFTKKIVADPLLVNEKNELVFAFLRIARDYINIKQYSYQSSKYICNKNGCKNTEFIVEEDDKMVCKQCSNIVYCLDEGASYKDSDRVNMTNRYKYSCEGHFIEAMDCYEGVHTFEGAPIVKNFILSELRLIDSGNVDVPKDDIHRILTENKMSENYKHINLLHSLITGKPCPCITMYRDEILDMNKYIEEGSICIKDDKDNESERINSINVYFKLYKCLQIVDFPCNSNDFYFLKTGDKRKEHEEFWKNLIAWLSAKYPQATTSNGKKRWRYIKT